MVCTFAFATLLLAAGCSKKETAVSVIRAENGYTPQKDESGNFIVDWKVSVVQFNAPLSGCGFVGDAADSFFDSVRWNGFDTDDGESFVDAAGKKGKDNYLLQFKVESFDSFSFYALEVNGKPQTESEKNAFLDLLFGRK